jgi:hypothetical protein
MATFAVAEGAGRPSRPWWEVAVAVTGGAAGLGLFVIVLGAIAMWVRFKAAGLPAGAGVASQSTNSLAGVGASDFALPIALNVLAAVAVYSYVDGHLRSVLDALRAGQPVPPIKLERWWSGKDLTIPVPKHRGIRAAVYVAVVPLLILDAPFKIFRRFGLAVLYPLWGVAFVPFEPSWVVLVIGMSVVWKWSACVNRTVPATPAGIRRARLFTAVGAVVVASFTAVTGEADPGPHFPTAVAHLKGGSQVAGSYVSFSGGTLYLGTGSSLRVILPSELAGFSVHDVRPSEPPPSLLMRGVEFVSRAVG